ncbi:MAG: ABC transporter [Gemmatales bacterium]|nr:MAG: ABC transporter [Gemmatales bacterium]
MKTPLAWLNFVHHKTRTLVALAGVSFAVILIFMQLGFRGAAEATATFLYSKIDDFEIFLVSSSYRDVNRTGTIPRTYLYRAMSLDEVESAYPLYISFSLWRNVTTGLRRTILVIGFRPTDPIFRGLPELEDPDLLRELHRLDTVLVDRMSHPDFGLAEMLPQTRITEVGFRRIEVVGQFTLGTGFASDASIITSADTFAALFPRRSLEKVNLGLVRLKRGADVKAVQTQLRAILPPDVQVWTRSELESRERDYWVHGKSIGILFTYGVFVAILVGVIFVYQIISADITNHYSEYATLKAMGYGNAYLSWVVLQQALYLGAIAYIPGLFAALLLYAVTRHYAHITIEMTFPRALGVLALALVMCTISGLLSVQKVKAADPADLF